MYEKAWIKEKFPKNDTSRCRAINIISKNDTSGLAILTMNNAIVFFITLLPMDTFVL